MPRRPNVPVPHTRVEYLILADHVEALNGKLYMMGGGWDSLAVQNLELPVPLSIACGVLVPYNETDEDHTLTLALRTPDGADIAPALNVRFRTGRAPTLHRGADSHVPFAIRAEFTFPGPGEFAVVGSVDDRGADAQRFKFYIVPVPGATPGAG